MSVPKGKRGISEMEFFKLSNDLYEKIEDWVLRDFGIRDKVRYDINDKNEPPVILRFPEWSVSYKRQLIMSVLDKFMNELIIANTIYPINYTELQDRRHHQNHAIAELEYLEQYLQRMLKNMPLSKTKAAQYFDLIRHVISIIKLWRKANSRIKRILDNNFKKDIKEFKENGNMANLMQWGLPNAVLEKIIAGKDEKGGDKIKTR